MIFDVIERLELYAPIIPELRDVAREIERKDFISREDGTYYTENGVRYFLQSFLSDPDKEMYEVHEKFIDVQIVLSGREMLKATTYEAKLPENFRKENDFGSKKEDKPEIGMVLTPGRFALLLPGEPHLPGLSMSETPENVRKAVFKIPFGY